MSQVKAYSEEHGRNISLDEAHILYFSQDANERNRFHFLCGDPHCRAMLKPKVIGALYDRTEVPGQKFRSPYFKRNSKYEHIKSCTWRTQDESMSQEEPVVGKSKSSGTVDDDIGLILKMKPRKSGGSTKKKPEINNPDFPDDDDEVNIQTGNPTPTSRARAATSRFMGTVAAKYLRYTDHERKTKILTLEGVHSAPFYNVCMPITGFHPHFQEKQVYFGKVKVVNLTNVFLIRFLNKMSPTGQRSARTFTAEVKFLKAWLTANDQDLANVLTMLAAGNRVSWCFFYTKSPVKAEGAYAKFTIDEHQLFAIVDEQELETLNPTAE
jgi:hypothetical protein